MKSKAAKEIIELQEQNRLLLQENKALRESLAVFTGDGEKTDPLVSSTPGYARSPARSATIMNYSTETLMCIIMNRMIELCRKDLQAQADEENGGGEENFMDSLRHVFVDSLHILCECMINPKGFWGVHAFDAMHPMSWLIDKFPVKEEDLTTTTANKMGAPHDDASIMGWYPLHWCCLSNSSDLIDVQVLSEHFCSTPRHRLKLNEEVSPLTLSVSKPQPNMEIVNALIEQDAMVLKSKSPVDGSLPIMHACAYNQDDTVARYLHKFYKDSLKEQDMQGYRAINYCASMGTDAVMEFLLKEDPKSGLYCTSSTRLLGPGDVESGGTGNTALHDAASNRRVGSGEDGDYGLSIEVVMELFHTNPNAIKLPNGDGALPLHIAARHGCLSLVQLLHGLYPSAAHVKDAENLLPLEYASERSDKEEGVEVVTYLAKL
jgi:ankyrin repeat protein